MLDGLEPQPNRFPRIVKDGPGRNGRFASTLLTVVHLASRPPGLQYGLILLLLSDVFPGDFFVSHAHTLTEVAVCPETIPPKKVASSIVQIIELTPKEIFLRPGVEKNFQGKTN